MSIISSPFDKKPNSINSLMIWVIAATLPGLFALVYFFGFGVTINLLLATTTALLAEAAILKLRKRPIVATLYDGSALVTAWLFALCLPPLLPWWMTILGCAFAIIVAKHLYGGLGNNIFNPAMVAYVLLLISFPVEMTAWLPPTELAAHSLSLGDTFSMIFTGSGANGETISQLRAGVDGFTMATPLDEVKTQLAQGYRLAEIKESEIISGLSGSGWGYVNLAFLAGGIILLFKKVIGWQIPAGVIGGIALCALFLHVSDNDHYSSPSFHLFSGATMLGAFFIATDPVTAATSARGRLIFGASIGVLVVLIRTFGGYPDAFAFAVLIMNMVVPMLDYYTKPKAYGHKSAGVKNAQ